MRYKNNRLRIKAVIFDLDGVIVETEPIHSLSWEKLIKSYGKKPIINKSGTIHTVGETGDHTYLEIMKRHDLKDNIKIIREKRRKLFVDIIKNTKLTPLPGFYELIEALKKENIKIAIASSRLIDHVLLILDNLKVNKFFSVINGKIEKRKPKPDPEIYLETAKELRITPNNCVAIEDSEAGVISAHSAGMKVLAVPNKLTIYQNFSKADKIVGSLKEINISLLQTL